MHAPALQTQEGYPLVEPALSTSSQQQGSAAAGGGAATEVAAGATEQQGRPTNRVHVYLDRWALQGEGYEPVTFPPTTVAADMAQSLFRSFRRALPAWLGGKRA